MVKFVWRVRWSGGVIVEWRGSSWCGVEGFIVDWRGLSGELYRVLGDGIYGAAL